MKRKYTWTPEGREKKVASVKLMWQMIAPRDRQAIAAKGGLAKNAKMTQEQKVEHGRMMVSKRATKLPQ